MITISAEYTTLFYAVFFLIIFGGMAWILVNMVTRIRAIQPDTRFPAPKPWSTEFLNDLAWTHFTLSRDQSPRRRVAVSALCRASELQQAFREGERDTIRGTTYRLEAAFRRACLTYRYESTGWLATFRRITLKSTQTNVELTLQQSPFSALRGWFTLFGLIGETKCSVHVNGSPLGAFHRQGKEIILHDLGGRAIGSWRVGGEHTYGALCVRGREVGELLQLRFQTPLLLMMQPGRPLLQNAPAQRNDEEESIILCFVALFCFGSSYALWRK